MALAMVPVLLGTTAGGLVALGIARLRYAGQNRLNPTLWPAALIGLALIPPSPMRILTITDRIDSAAPPAAVHVVIQSIPAIAASRVQSRLVHLPGAPKPSSATSTDTPGRPLRVSRWGDDVVFQRRITQTVPDRAIDWTLAFAPDWIAPGIKDPHLCVDGDYLDFLSGSDTLTDLGNRTRLTLTTRTRDSSGLGTYAAFWHGVFFHDFHRAILPVVKSRVEAA